MGKPEAQTETDLYWGICQDAMFCLLFWQIYGKERNFCCNKHQMKATDQKASRQLFLLGISLIRQSPTCALQVKTPTEQYQVDGDGGEAAGTDTNELELGLGQEVMFYHYGEFKRGLAHVWIRHCLSQIVPPPLDMAYTCHCSFHLLIISWDCLCHYPPPFRYLC